MIKSLDSSLPHLEPLGSNRDHFSPVMFIGDNHENPAKNDQISRIVMPHLRPTRIQALVISLNPTSDQNDHFSPVMFIGNNPENPAKNDQSEI